MTNRVIKPWGWEVIVHEGEDYLLKVLQIHPGHRTSLHYHERKHETLIVDSNGGGLIELGDRTITALIGTSVEIEPGEVHRFTAPERDGLTLIEASTSHPTDVVRVEDDYQRNE